MAFTFTVEDGTNIAGSNSYLTVAEADDYFVIDRVFCEVWDALSPSDKQYRLAWAARILDQKVRWKGVRTDETQSMEWPRQATYDRNGVSIDSDEIPEQLKDAVCEFVKFVQTEDPTVGAGVDYIRAITLDVLEIEYQEGTSQNDFPNLLNSLLRGLGAYPVPGNFGFNSIAKA